MALKHSSTVPSHLEPVLSQLPSWTDVKLKEGWDRAESFVIDVEPRAWVQFLVKETPFGDFYYAPGGPLLGKTEIDYVESVIEQIELFVSDKPGIAFVRLAPRIESEQVSSVLENNLTRGNSIYMTGTVKLDLTRNKAELKDDMGRSWRKHLKNATENVERVDEDGLDEFYSMLEATAERNSFSLPPKPAVKGRLKAFSDTGLYIAYTPEGLPAAGGMAIVSSGRAWLDISASYRDRWGCRPNQALHWNIIKDLKSRGVRKYDLRGVPLDASPSDDIYGIYEFKKGVGGEIIRFPGEFDIYNRYVVCKGFNLLLPYYLKFFN